MNPYTRIPKIAGLALLLACWGCITPAAQAQVFRATDDVEPVVILPLTEEAPLAELSSRDLSTMSAAWWKELREGHIRLLGSSDEQLKAQALQNIIFFAKVYPGKVDFSRAVSRLLKIYRSDKNEDHRIMALAALHAIGSERAMEQLREHVREEKSERVRRHTLYALADYYKNQGTQ